MSANESGFSPDTTRPTIETYNHPLYAVLGGEAVSLEGHLQRGVIRVLEEVATERGYEIPPGQVAHLINDPEELDPTK